MTAPVYRDCRLCGERHARGEYTRADLMEAISILDARILGTTTEDEPALPASPHPGYEDAALRPVAELLGLVLAKLAKCPVCPCDPGEDDPYPRPGCECGCHADEDQDED